MPRIKMTRAHTSMRIPIKLLEDLRTEAAYRSIPVSTFIVLMLQEVITDCKKKRRRDKAAEKPDDVLS